MNQQEKEIQCFGFSLDNIRESIESSFTFQHSGYQMVAMSLMSDAQESMALGNTEWARKLLNQAKWVLSTYREKN
jgi:hypothetical protein